MVGGWGGRRWGGWWEDGEEDGGEDGGEDGEEYGGVRFEGFPPRRLSGFLAFFIPSTSRLHAHFVFIALIYLSFFFFSTHFFSSIPSNCFSTLPFFLLLLLFFRLVFSTS